MRKQAPTQIWNIAHRGARAFAPENTLCAFEKAKSFGCSMFEIDVHRSRDGELIVHHDDQLTRCTNVAVKFPRRKSHFVSDFTLAELRELDAGSWFVRELELPAKDRQPFLQTLTAAEMRRCIKPEDWAMYESGLVRVPTLRETLEVAMYTEMLVNIELKALPRMNAGLAEAAVALVEHMGMESRVLISSFDHEQLRIVRRLSDAIATGVLTCDPIARPAEYMQLLDADAYNPGCSGDHDSRGVGPVSGVLDANGIREVRTARRGVNVWTCNNKSQMRTLIDAGVTGLITDFPNRVREVLAKHSGR